MSYNLDLFKEGYGYKISFPDLSHIDAEYLRSFRERHNLSQLRLSNIIRVDVKTILRWENKKIRIPGPTKCLIYLLDSERSLIDVLYKIEKREEYTNDGEYEY